MGWTKRQFIEQAYAEIGLAGYVSDLRPDQLDQACSKLDAMMAAWNALGIRVGFPIGASPASNNISTVTEVPDAANEAIYSNLAIRLAGSVGKQLSVELKATAGAGYRALLTHVVKAIPVQQPVNMVLGQGNRRRSRQNFVNPPSETLDTGLDSTVDDLEI